MDKDLQDYIQFITAEALKEVSENGWRNCSSNVLILACFGALAYNATEKIDGLSKELKDVKKTVGSFGWKVVSTVLVAIAGLIVTAILF